MWQFRYLVKAILQEMVPAVNISEFLGQKQHTKSLVVRSCDYKFSHDIATVVKNV